MKLLIQLLLALALQFAIQPAHATFCGDPGTGDPARKCAAAGNPIDVISGNKFQREVDLAPLPGVMGLEVVRYYNSRLSGPDNQTAISGDVDLAGYCTWLNNNAYFKEHTVCKSPGAP